MNFIDKLEREVIQRANQKFNDTLFDYLKKNLLEIGVNLSNDDLIAFFKEKVTGVCYANGARAGYYADIDGVNTLIGTTNEGQRNIEVRGNELIYTIG